MAKYHALIEWEASATDDVPGGKYGRGHRWTFDENVSVPASSSKHVVPLPWSVEAAVDPEEALVASASSCHMLTFLYLTIPCEMCIRDRHHDAHDQCFIANSVKFPIEVVT